MVLFPYEEGICGHGDAEQGQSVHRDGGGRAHRTPRELRPAAEGPAGAALLLPLCPEGILPQRCASLVLPDDRRLCTCVYSSSSLAVLSHLSPITYCMQTSSNPR